jgi:hypothetical protein
MEEAFRCQVREVRLQDERPEAEEGGPKGSKGRKIDLQSDF